MRALNASPLGSERNRSKMLELVLAVVCSVFVFVFLQEMESRSGEIAYVLPATSMSLFFIAWLFCGIYRRAKPSPLGLQPISWKKRVGYAYLSNLVYVILISVAIVVFVFVFLLLVALFVFLSTGYWTFVIEESEFTYEYAPVMNQLFAAFSALFVYGAGACLAAVPKKKWRIGLYVAFPVALKLFSVLVINIAFPSPYIYWFGDVTNILMTSNLSAMWLTLAIILGVGVTALSVYLNIRAEKPSKI